MKSKTRGPRSLDEQTPDDLIPRLGELAVSSTTHSVSVAITETVHAGESLSALEGCLSVPDRQDAGQHARPAIGVRLVHEQGWFARGVALGDLVNSVCLAPGEITQVAVSRRRRTARGAAHSEQAATEELAQEQAESSALDEVQQAVAREAQTGSSSTETSSDHEQSGLSGGFLGLFGGSAGVARNSAASRNVSRSTGERQVATEANQNLHQSAMQHAQRVRAQHGTEVREVAETESSDLQTRVVANYNHMHALTIQYYQVLQVYELQTRVVSAERVLFVPMVVARFDVATELVQDAPEGETRFTAGGVVARHRHRLAEAARSLGMHAVAAALEWSRIPAELREGRRKALGDERAGCAQAAVDAEAVLASAREDVITATDALLVARDAFRDAVDPGLAEEARLKRAVRDRGVALEQARARLVAARAKARGASRADQSAAQRVELLALAETLTCRDIVKALDERRLEVNQALWLQLDEAAVIALLAPFKLHDQPLANDVDPRPVAVSGNLVGFRWNHADAAEAHAFRAQHVGRMAPAESVALPSGGVFAEAVLGESNSAEKLDIRRFWNWHDALPPIRPAEIDALRPPDSASAQAPGVRAMNRASGLWNPLTYAKADGLGDVLGEAASSGDLFRDMSGPEACAQLAQAAAKLRADKAHDAADLADETLQRLMQFQRKVLDVAMSAGGGLDPSMAGAAANSAEAEADSDPEDDHGAS